MKQYIVTVNGIDHEMQLDDKDAKRYRAAKMLKEPSESLGETQGDENPPEDSESTEDPKEGSGEAKETAKPANKSTRAANKAG